MGVERELDRLFGLPLGDFTQARNDLVKRLRAEHATEEADMVGALQKPTVPVWTINQLCRVDRAGVRALTKAGEELRTAQERLLCGEDAGGALREAAVRERQALERLAERARAVLDDAKRPATAAVLDRIGTTLRAAALTDDGRALLASGRLTTELEPPGFDAVGPAETRAGPGRKPKPKQSRPGDEPAERRRQREEGQRRRRELRAAARAAQRVAREAEREAERAEAAAAEARRVAEQARAEADAAAAALADA